VREVFAVTDPGKDEPPPPPPPPEPQSAPVPLTTPSEFTCRHCVIPVTSIVRYPSREVEPDTPRFTNEPFLFESMAVTPLISNLLDVLMYPVVLIFKLPSMIVVPPTA
jgi:hypothetical protein